MQPASVTVKLAKFTTASTSVMRICGPHTSQWRIFLRFCAWFCDCFAYESLMANAKIVQRPRTTEAMRR